MKQYYVIFISLILTSCWQTETVPTTHEKKEATIGSTFDVKLESNPSTGYSWKVVTKPEQIIDFTSEYIKPEKVMPGAPGKQRFTFKVSDDEKYVETSGQIELVYERPWEEKPVKKFVIEIKVIK